MLRAYPPLFPFLFRGFPRWLNARSLCFLRLCAIQKGLYLWAKIACELIARIRRRLAPQPSAVPPPPCDCGKYREPSPRA